MFDDWIRSQLDNSPHSKCRPLPHGSNLSIQHPTLHRGPSFIQLIIYMAAWEYQAFRVSATLIPSSFMLYEERKLTEMAWPLMHDYTQLFCLVKKVEMRVRS